MVVLGRLDDAQRIVADGSKCWRLPRVCSRRHRHNRWLLARERCLSGRRIDQRSDERDVVCGKSAAADVLADGFGVVGEVQTVDLVVGDEAVNPLRLRCHAGEILLIDTGHPRTAGAPGGPCPRSWMW